MSKKTSSILGTSLAFITSHLWLVGGVSLCVALVVGMAMELIPTPDWQTLDEVRATVGVRRTLEELKVLAQATPNDGAIHFELGHAQFEAAQPRAGLSSYDRALSLDE